MILADQLLDPSSWVKAFKDFCLWVASQVGVEIRWVILAAIVIVVVHWFTKDRGR